MVEGSTNTPGPLAGARRIMGMMGSGEPCVVLVAGMHGNEPAGVLALDTLFKELEQRNDLKGTVVGLAGNLQALRKGVRAIDTDLNRVWTEARVGRDMIEGPLRDELGAEAEEMHALNKVLHETLDRHRRLYFIDLHTTSAATAPFVTMNDTLANRAFVRGLEVPVVLGIEEYLHGPLLSWLMERGHVAMAFESGSHEDPASVHGHLLFCRLALTKAGVLPMTAAERERHFAALDTKDGLRHAIFDVRLRKAIGPSDTFRMLPGFTNFDPVGKGRPLASMNDEMVHAPYDAHLFMPLYQAQGSDGYFLVKKVPRFWMALSAVLRSGPWHGLLGLLPGVRRLEGDRRRFLVDPRVARSKALPFFHLLGYRLEEKDGPFLRFIRRERRHRGAP